MKKNITAIILIGFITTCFMAGCGAGVNMESSSIIETGDPGTTNPTINSNETVLSIINQYRGAGGMPPVSLSHSLAKAADAHAEYCIAYPGSGHYQIEENSSLFTGKTPQERAEFFGYKGPVGENLHYIASPQEAIMDFISAPYHRVIILHPDATHIGYGKREGKQMKIDVLDVGYQFGSDKTICYPSHNQIHVPYAWHGRENPDPFPELEYPAGYPISITFPVNMAVEVVSVELTETGNSVPIIYHDPSYNSLMLNSVFIISTSPMKPDTLYEVKLEVMLDGMETTHSWEFTTGSSEYRGADPFNYNQTMPDFPFFSI